ncbi:hypothetical protein Cst_c12680 [Thermoclostridium stercorarium subsp. stercorarium DSM 8532]|jgi:prepilin-type N-terminal cleavage/methylation domain-containing protein|uniref:Prepilin-type N-terminal cleavage/methylation domain-containing protein n=2 Tax=Thermoclostridium stercorarium TaxID=1510 RepID=L7VNL6_THES1|nr:prepilin-type N-terminal cleavage/methylation domain-containing protein [Thermoclostridium stercorarium]AGC68259.1 hypothetical protein Cst_c12680 [Thermoclostridium stercorarium subsp. stercorarium DSM 8532]AGI39286.1 methylation domain-containing protein [Thermoclostridium stercorarium subsp. stercorarium DSM 8532]ANX01161.1 hypothetical protein CSTERLE_06025 [Thermoclostridium stercorarium subsp. leptospartum DSM 9219]
MNGKRLSRNLPKYACFRICKDGFTLIEAVVSIAIVAILSVVIYSLFFSMSKISKYSEEQLKRYAVIRVIKENVAYSVRNDAEITGTNKKALNLNRAGAGKFEYLPVKDLAGNEYPEYVFDLEYMGTAGINVYRYKVALKPVINESDKFEFMFEVYRP